MDILLNKWKTPVYKCEAMLKRLKTAISEVSFWGWSGKYQKPPTHQTKKYGYEQSKINKDVS